MPDPGYIAGYPPGVRENGGQYTHAAVWAVMAFVQAGRVERAWQLFDLINPLRHAADEEGVEIYKGEPYVVAADVYANPAHRGRGGWSWYTGSAGWMYRLLIETFLGLTREGSRLRIAPRCVMMGGESVSPAVRQHVARAFRAVVRSSYGTSEFLPIAWECAHGQLHVNADWVLLEPVDEQQRPVPPGQRSDTVLLTNLVNTVQPLIRYDLGDRITWHGSGCACGSALPVIEVLGRHDDVMHVPACQSGRTVALLPLALCTVLEEECGVFDFQLRQQGPDTLVLRLGLHGEQGAATVERCRDALQRFASAQGAQPIRVLAELGCEVPRGRSGKACRVALDAAA